MEVVLMEKILKKRSPEVLLPAMLEEKFNEDVKMWNCVGGIVGCWADGRVCLCEGGSVRRCGGEAE